MARPRSNWPRTVLLAVALLALILVWKSRVPTVDRIEPPRKRAKPPASAGRTRAMERAGRNATGGGKSSGTRKTTPSGPQPGGEPTGSDLLDSSANLSGAISVVQFRAVYRLIGLAQREGAEAALGYVRAMLKKAGDLSLPAQAEQEILVRALPGLVLVDPAIRGEVITLLLVIVENSQYRPNIRLQAVGALVGLPTTQVTTMAMGRDVFYGYDVMGLRPIVDRGTSVSLSDGRLITPTNARVRLDGYREVARTALEQVVQLRDIESAKLLVVGVRGLISEFGAEAESAITRLLQDEQVRSTIKGVAVRDFARANPNGPGLKLALESLRSSSEDVAGAALEVLPEIQPYNERVEAELLRLAGSESLWVRYKSLTAAARYLKASKTGEINTLSALIDRTLVGLTSINEREQKDGMNALLIIRKYRLKQFRPRLVELLDRGCSPLANARLESGVQELK